MSYIRGEYYTYESANGFYLFHLGFVPADVVDEFVVMRYAELCSIKAQGLRNLAEGIENRAMYKHSGNFGCDALCRKRDKKGGMDFLLLFAKALELQKLGLSEEEVDSALEYYKEVYWEEDSKRLV